MAKCENCYYAGVCKDYPDTGVPPEIKCELIFAIFRLLEASSDSECAPAADVESVKHGCWIINSDGYYPQCSECMKEPQGRVMTDWCPNCGAKMDGGE